MENAADVEKELVVLTLEGLDARESSLPAPIFARDVGARPKTNLTSLQLYSTTIDAVAKLSPLSTHETTTQ